MDFGEEWTKTICKGGLSHLDGDSGYEASAEAKYNGPRRAAFYIRVSTKEQAEKGWSVEGQEKDIRAWMEVTHVVPPYICRSLKFWSRAFGLG